MDFLTITLLQNLALTKHSWVRTLLCSLSYLKISKTYFFLDNATYTVLFRSTTNTQHISNYARISLGKDMLAYFSKCQQLANRVAREQGHNRSYICITNDVRQASVCEVARIRFDIFGFNLIAYQGIE